VAIAWHVRPIDDEKALAVALVPLGVEYVGDGVS
jgi:hypothetical protein